MVRHCDPVLARRWPFRRGSQQVRIASDASRTSPRSSQKTPALADLPAKDGETLTPGCRRICPALQIAHVCSKGQAHASVATASNARHAQRDPASTTAHAAVSQGHEQRQPWREARSPVEVAVVYAPMPTNAAWPKEVSPPRGEQHQPKHGQLEMPMYLSLVIQNSGTGGRLRRWP